MPEDRPCHNCHHPKGLHDFTEGGLCARFLACGCHDYIPMACRFGCYDGRVVPERVRYIIKWHLGLAGREAMNDEIDQIVLTLDREAALQYPEWPEVNPHHDHIHIEMRQEDVERTLDEQQAEGGV